MLLLGGEGMKTTCPECKEDVEVQLIYRFSHNQFKVVTKEKVEEEGLKRTYYWCIECGEKIYYQGG